MTVQLVCISLQLCTQQDEFLAKKIIWKYSNLEVYHRYWDPEMEERKRMGQKPRLWFALLKYFKWTLVSYGILFLSEVSVINFNAFDVTYL